MSHLIPPVNERRDQAQVRARLFLAFSDNSKSKERGEKQQQDKRR